MCFVTLIIVWIIETSIYYIYDLNDIRSPRPYNTKVEVINKKFKDRIKTTTDFLSCPHRTNLIYINISKFSRRTLTKDQNKTTTDYFMNQTKTQKF